MSNLPGLDIQYVPVIVEQVPLVPFGSFYLFSVERTCHWLAFKFHFDYNVLLMMFKWFSSRKYFSPIPSTALIRCRPTWDRSELSPWNVFLLGS